MKTTPSPHSSLQRIAVALPGFLVLLLCLCLTMMPRAAYAQTLENVMGAYSREAGLDALREPALRLELRRDRRARLKRYVPQAKTGEEISIGQWRLRGGKVEVLLAIRDKASVKENITFTRASDGSLSTDSVDAARYGNASVTFAKVDKADLRNVTGTISYLQRVALPPGALVEVFLADITDGDGYSVVARQKIKNPGQVPVRFLVPYLSVDIDPRHKYVIIGKIFNAESDKTPQFDNTGKPVSVLTQGAGAANIEVVLPMARLTDLPASGEAAKP